MKFTEAKLEAAIIQLLGEQGYAHQPGVDLERPLSEVLFKGDLRDYLAERYAADSITPAEIESVVRQVGNPACQRSLRQQPPVHEVAV